LYGYLKLTDIGSQPFTYMSHDVLYYVLKYFWWFCKRKYSHFTRYEL